MVFSARPPPPTVLPIPRAPARESHSVRVFVGRCRSFRFGILSARSDGFDRVLRIIPQRRLERRDHAGIDMLRGGLNSLGYERDIAFASVFEIRFRLVHHFDEFFGNGFFRA